MNAAQIFASVKGEFIGKTEEICVVVGLEPFFKEVIGVAEKTHISCPLKNFFIPILQKAAEKMVVIHNHPNGLLAPSKEDLLSTQTLIEGANLLGITFVDHLIVHEEQFVSLYALGHIPQREVY